MQTSARFDIISGMANETKNARIERWTKKMLDFSARNRLLNIPRSSRQVMRIMCPDVAGLEDRIAANKAISIRSLADAAGEKALAAATAGQTDEKCAKILADELAKHRLCVAMPAKDVQKRLAELMRDARSAIEESGVNTLFLTAGELEWTDPAAGAAQKKRRAPILMIPVRLARASMSEGVKMYRRDEETEINPTLVEFLRSQFGVAPEGIDPLPADDSGVDVKKILDSFRKAIAGRDGWGVFEDATIGCYSFGKFVMWKDMTDRMDSLVKNPLVKHIVEGGGRFDDGIETFPEEDVASHVKPGELYCPVSYDSSQLAAVLYSAMGKTFVLHGPPGTGKSQTITNIIAHNLALGRRILFVSEKKAALDVVKNRLDRIGLSPFCLELHSNKIEKSRFYAQIREALEVPNADAPAEREETVAGFERHREELDAYVRELHARRANGLTAYECFASRMAHGDTAAPLACEALSLSPADAAALRDGVSAMAADWRATSAEAVAALAPAAGFEWTPAAERELGEAIAALAAAISKNGFAFVPKDKTSGAARALSAAEMRAAAAKAESLAAKGPFLKKVLSFFAGIGKARADAGFAETLGAAGRFVRESRAVMRYRASRAAVAAKAGEGFVKAMESGAFAPEKAQEEFDRALREKTLEELMSGVKELSGFAGLRRDEQTAEFRLLAAKCAALAQKAMVARLVDALPIGLRGPGDKGTELGMIKRECEKKTRQKPVRQLIAESKTMLPALKPCFLMSPLSVAQYLPADSSAFDLVVFDEASQIPVWDAIGVIARAKQTIVVGDPKQMPPTSFFQKGDDDGDDGDEYDPETVEDQESILDECLVAGVFSSHLNWHYRSRHESLIAFSNEHYYDGRLCTFPAAATTPRLGVKFMFVPDGRFCAQGKGPRVNETEAKALVDYICGEVLKPGWKKRSIGVVTFSLPQQKLVASMLEERRGDNPELERLLPEDGEGAYFVKNLENVQGDESDVILFSIGYAPDENGRFTMNFGPLNLAGGERRLNVAATRAKEQIVVFSSIRASQIDAGEGARAKAVGAGHLKAFLEYAERGGEAADAFAPADGGVFGDVVADFLKKNGYDTDRDVGCGRFRIDVAVRDPENPGRHILGIECDGPSYAGQRTAQDRDVNRAGVLEGLGWKICRVWSVDWAFDREKAGRRLLDELRRG